MIGETLSHYKLGSELGRGGMGVVYRAKDSTLDRTVAIKFLASELTSNAVARERFIREAKAAAAIEHQSICSVHEIGETEDGETYIVMPYYEGLTLKELIASGRQSPSKALDIGKQVASGLAAAHDKGVVHRDMKPGNVMLTTRNRAIILDFGLAKLGGQSDLTRSRSSVGTLPYMAPEQLRGEKVDHRTDIWGLGTVLYEVVAGQRPFQGEYEAAVSYSILNVDPPRLDSICDDLPEGFCDIIGRCLAKNPEDRYQTAEELLIDLEAPGSASVLPVAVASPALVATAKTTPPVSRFIFRTVLAGIAIAALGIAYLQFSGVEEERIAILPFQVVGDDADLETLSKGLRQVILDRLSELQYEDDALLMVPLTSFDTPESVPDARRSYGASLVISTVVERSGPVIQLSFSLLNAENEIELASDQLVYTGTDQTSLQQASLHRITSLLGLDTDEYSASDSLAGVTASFAYLSGVGYLTAPDSLGDVNRGIEQLLDAREDRRLASRADVGLGHGYLKKFELTGNRELLGEAVSHFESALRSDAKLSQASFGMIYLYKRDEDKAAAIQEFEKAKEAAPGNFEVLRKYAQFHSAAHDTELADSLFSLLLTAAPNVWIVYNSFGNHYLRTDRLNKAIDVLTIGLELAPENPTLLNTLAVSQYRTGDLHATMEILAPVAVANRANKVALKNLGVAYFYLGMYPNAVRTFEDYLDIDSTKYEVIGFLADAYFWMGGQRGKANEVYERAIGEAERRLSSHGQDTQALESLTWYFANIGQVDSAMAFLNQTLDVYSKREGEVSGKEALGLGEVYVVLGDIDRSKYWIEKAAENNNDWTKFDNSPWLEEIRSDSSFIEKISSYRTNN